MNVEPDSTSCIMLHEADRTRTLSEQLQDEDRLERACQHILAAYKQVSPVYVRSSFAARCVNSFVHKLRLVKWAAVLFLVLLSVYERPVWCLKQDKVDGQYACDTKLYPGWGHTYLSLETAFGWEAVCLLMLSLLEIGHAFAGGVSYMRPTKNKINAVLLGIAWVDMAVAIITPATFFRLGPLVRISILANKSSRIRRELYLLAKIIPGLSSLLLLTLLNLAFFAFFGLVLFHEIKGAEQYFGTFGRAMWQLWVLQTTSNFPDIMMAVYEKARSSYIYFLAFILLSTFFMMNLFTAVVYSKYTTLEDQYEKHALARTERHLTTAFSMLDIDCSGELSKVEMLAVVNQLRKAHLLPELQGGVTASLLFAALDSERNNVISKEEFMELCTVLKVQWEEEDRETYFQRHWPRLYNSSAFQRLRQAVLSTAFQWGCDVTVLLMCVATVWETLWRLNHGLGPAPRAVDGKLDDVWNIIELIFTIVFTVEVILKLIVQGWHAYWMDVTNRLEFVTALGCLLVTVCVYVPNDFDDSRWIRYTAFLRLLRLFRLFKLLQLPSMLRFIYVIVSVEHIKLFYETFLAMLPAAIRLCQLMFCIIYVYAALGVAFFGGKVSVDKASPEYAVLSKMAFGESGYWTINFNDMPSGCVLMVQLLVVNNWMVFTEAFVAVTDPIAFIFFCSFYLFGVIAGLNILVSFVLDAFVGELESSNAEAAETAAAQGDRDAIDNDHDYDPPAFHHVYSSRSMAVAVVDGSLLADSTDVKGTWRARMKGYETSSRKAEKLLELIRRQKPGPVSQIQAAARQVMQTHREAGGSSSCSTPTAPLMDTS